MLVRSRARTATRLVVRNWAATTRCPCGKSLEDPKLATTIRPLPSGSLANSSSFATAQSAAELEVVSDFEMLHSDGVIARQRSRDCSRFWKINQRIRESIGVVRRSSTSYSGPANSTTLKPASPLIVIEGKADDPSLVRRVKLDIKATASFSLLSTASFPWTEAERCCAARSCGSSPPKLESTTGVEADVADGAAESSAHLSRARRRPSGTLEVCDA